MKSNHLRAKSSKLVTSWAQSVTRSTTTFPPSIGLRCILKWWRRKTSMKSLNITTTQFRKFSSQKIVQFKTLCTIWNLLSTSLRLDSWKPKKSGRSWRNILISSQTSLRQATTPVMIKPPLICNHSWSNKILMLKQLSSSKLWLPGMSM